jgi:hypothetical protein
MLAACCVRRGRGGGHHGHGGGSGTTSATMVGMCVFFITLPRHTMKPPYFMYLTFWLSQGGGLLFRWVPGYNCLIMVTGSRKPGTQSWVAINCRGDAD